MSILRRGFVFAVLLVTVTGSQAVASSIVGSRHDMTFLLTKPMMNGAFNDYHEVCVYCHTPHGANPAGGPLWNRSLPNASVFTLYNSSTMDTSPGEPSVISLLCLSCHDGTIAMDNIFNMPNTGTSFAGLHQKMDASGCAGCHGETPLFGAPDLHDAFLGIDLSDDHPISMTYPTAEEDDQFFLPPDLNRGWPDVPLYDGKVECPSCHDVHDPDNQPFLRIANNQSALCLRCHDK